MVRMFYALGIVAAGLVATLAAASPAAADDLLVVLSSSGPQFHPADKLPPQSAITLAAGQTLTLVAADGTVIELKGPFQGPPRGALETKTASVTDMLTPLLQKASAETATPGVIRDALAGPDSDPWVLDASASGDVCVHQAVSYDLWRPDAKAAGAVSLVPLGGGTPLKLSFAAGQSRVGIPDSFNFVDAGSYRLERGGALTTITVHTVPDSIPPQSRMTAAWFASKNCHAQAEALARKLVQAK